MRQKGSDPANPVSYEHVNLLLKIYDLRREQKLRAARQWFMMEFHANSLEDYRQKYTAGSDEEAYIRMVTSYWDMVAAIVNHGAIDDDLFLETTGEHFLVWEKYKHLVPAIRSMFKNPFFLHNLEKLAERTEEWREKLAPGSTEAFRQFLQARWAQPAPKARKRR